MWLNVTTMANKKLRSTQKKFIRGSPCTSITYNLHGLGEQFTVYFCHHHLLLLFFTCFFFIFFLLCCLPACQFASFYLWLYVFVTCVLLDLRHRKLSHNHNLCTKCTYAQCACSCFFFFSHSKYECFNNIFFFALQSPM